MLLACYAAADSPLTRLTVWVALMPLSTLRLIWDLSKVIQTQTENRTFEELNCFQAKRARIFHSSRNHIQQSTIHTSTFNKHAVLHIANANVVYMLWPTFTPTTRAWAQWTIVPLNKAEHLSYPRWDSNVFKKNCFTIGDKYYNWI